MSGNVYKGSIHKGLCGCSGFWWGPPSRSKEIQHLQFKELPVQPQDNMGSVLAKYLVGNLAWVPPFGGILARADPEKAEGLLRKGFVMISFRP